MTARVLLSAAIAVTVGVVGFALLAGDDGGRDAGRLDGPPSVAAGWSDEGRRVFAAMGCGSCHRLAAAGSRGTIGPNLDEELAGHDRDSLVDRIVDTPGNGFTTMPDDYGERMTDAELDALVTFLLASR